MAIIGTPYDDVFHTIVNDCGHLTISVVNEMFQKKYELTEEVTFLKNEHFLQNQAQEGEKVTDSCVQLQDEKYHVECQSTPDGSMAERMFEYDSCIALEGSELENHVLDIKFPHSGILYLRSTSGTPDRLAVRLHTTGDDATYYMPIMKIKDYDLDKIFHKELYFLIPFYLFTFENRFAKMESDEEQLGMLKEEYADILKRLEAVVSVGRMNEFTKWCIIEMTRKVAENLAVNFEKVRKGVLDVMGGRILSYEAKDILFKGRQEGLQEKAMICYLNAVGRGMSHEDAMAIAELTEEQTKKALDLRENGKI